jgi:short-subunit dehydrogenase involved in D-alanine esterification of teichoic acids
LGRNLTKLEKIREKHAEVMTVVVDFADMDMNKLES